MESNSRAPALEMNEKKDKKRFIRRSELSLLVLEILKNVR